MLGFDDYKKDMMEIKNIKPFRKGLSILLGVCAGAFISSCNTEFEERLDFGQDTDTSAYRLNESTKILYIMVDGGVGSVMVEESQKDDINPNLYALTQNALFTGNSVADESADTYTTYADMLIGVTKEKHGVTGPSDHNLSNYPMFFYNLKAENAEWRTAAYVRSSFLHDELVTDADVNTLLMSDEAVRNAAVDELANPDASVVLAQFRGVEEAGDQYGFGPLVPEYVAAIHTFDGYLGALMTALRARESYATEKWLIVVASNKGGDYQLQEGESDNTVYSEPNRNAFVILANDRFLFNYVPKRDYRNLVYEGYAIRMSSSSRGTIAAELADIYNIGTSGDYTIQLRIKCHDKGTLNPAIISKQNNTGNSDAGWSFIHNGGLGWRFKIQGTQFSSATVLQLEEWATLTAKVYMDGGTRRLKMFTNGTLEGTNTLGTAQGTSTAPLNVGYSASYQGGAVNQTVTDIRIYNAALSDEYIQNNYCQTVVRRDDPYYDALIGYWPAITPNNRGTIEDLSPSKRDFILTNSDSWAAFLASDDHICPSVPDGLEKLVPAPIDVPLFIYNWMGVRNVQHLALDGQNWLPTYAGL